MIEILGVKLTYEAVGFLTAFILSEVIAASKLKENSVAQLVKTLIDTFRPARKEDEKVVALRQAAEAVAAAAKALDD